MDNEKIIQSQERLAKAQEKQVEVNAMILQSLSDLKRQGQQRISYGQEEGKNGAYGSRSHGGHMLDRDDTIKGVRWMDTPDRRGSGYGFYFSSGSKRHHGHQCYHTYRRSEKRYLLDEFKKAKPPTFDGELKKLEDSKAWLLGMKKFLKLNDYLENMKDMITIFSLKGKSYIWWEYMKHVRGIR